MGGGASKAAGDHAKFSQQYMLTRELGSGAFSVVKLGIHKTTKHHSAVKIVNKKKLTPEDNEALMMEIGILKSLDHPNIIKYVIFSYSFIHFYSYTVNIRSSLIHSLQNVYLFLYHYIHYSLLYLDFLKHLMKVVNFT